MSMHADSRPEPTRQGNSVAAIVVSFNRCDLLAKVLDGLAAQTRRIDEIIVIDNGSTDHTRDMLEARSAEISVVYSATNSGGAGGFARGLAWALNRGHRYGWLMDDDAVPDVDCLDQMLRAVSVVGEFSFIAPRVTDAAGETGPRNFPILDTQAVPMYRAAGHGLLAATAATFVGPLIDLDVAKRTHLPLSDFFIWHDDYEYTNRLAALAPGYSAPAATICHYANNAGPNAYHDTRNLFNIRNLLWWYREARSQGLPRSRRIFITFAYSARKQYALAPTKGKFVRIFLRAVSQAVFSRPTHYHAAELLRGPAAQDITRFLGD